MLFGLRYPEVLVHITRSSSLSYIVTRNKAECCRGEGCVRSTEQYAGSLLYLLLAHTLRVMFPQSTSPRSPRIVSCSGVRFNGKRPPTRPPTHPSGTHIRSIVGDITGTFVLRTASDSGEPSHLTDHLEEPQFTVVPTLRSSLVILRRWMRQRAFA